MMLEVIMCSKTLQQMQVRQSLISSAELSKFSSLVTRDLSPPTPGDKIVNLAYHQETILILTSAL